MRAPCPRCHQESPRHVRARDVNRRTSNEIFDYYRCGDCGIIFLWPIPKDLGQYYAGNYYGLPESLEELARVAEPERYKIEIVRRFASKGRLLEIGPAFGGFCYHAKQAGFAADAIEMDETCCTFMNHVVGIRAIQSADTEAALRALGQYDVIVLWHVIEHLPDPWSILKLIAKRLDPDGILVIAAPNPEAVQFRVLGRYWTHLDAPRHLELIPMRILNAHALKLGLQPVLETTTDPGSLGWNFFGWETSLSNFSNNTYIKRALRIVGRVLGRLCRVVERIEGRGSAYTVVYRKVERA
jgi:2-polyprenyl-3-methyl-5-hydroxy-6-metoxy-1,4-benzoquinol methylase